MTKTYALLLLVSLAACGASEDQPGPGGVTVEDAQALDEAAAKLDKENSTDPAPDVRAE